MKNCLFCKNCINDPEVGYECSLNSPDNWVHSWKDQVNSKSCPDFELDKEYLEEQLNSNHEIPTEYLKAYIDSTLKLKDYCITFKPRSDNIYGRLMGTKQTFMKLPDDSAEKLKKLFECSEEFLIEEFKLHQEKVENYIITGNKCETCGYTNGILYNDKACSICNEVDNTYNSPEPIETTSNGPVCVSCGEPMGETYRGSMLCWNCEQKIK